MALGRALKEKTTCSPANERKVTAGGKEKIPTPASKQYTFPKVKNSAPNYPAPSLPGTVMTKGTGSNKMK